MRTLTPASPVSESLPLPPVTFSIPATEVKPGALGVPRLTVTAPDDMKLKAVVDILQSRLHKRGVTLKALTYGEIEQGGRNA